jgi:hypothetical protein
VGLHFAVAKNALVLNLAYDKAKEGKALGFDLEESKVAVYLGMSPIEMAVKMGAGETFETLLHAESQTHGIDVNYAIEAIALDLNWTKAEQAFALGLSAKTASKVDNLEAAAFAKRGLLLGLSLETLIEAAARYAESNGFTSAIGFDLTAVKAAVDEGKTLEEAKLW